MSDKLIRGKDVIVSLYKDPPGSYVPVLCAKSCTFTRSYEVKETTHWASTAREFTLGMYEWNVSLEGVMTAQSLNSGADYTIFEIYELANGPGAVQVSFADPSGVERFLTGTVIFPEISFSGDVSDFSSFSLTLKGTGEVVLS